jgi:hypothetical protein
MKTIKITLRVIGMASLLIGFDFAIQKYAGQLWFFGCGWLIVLISFFMKTPEKK